jgi:hypothetical protein
MEISKGDIVYIYEYKNRNDAKDFDSLIEVEVDTVAPNTNIVSGFTLKNGNYIINQNGAKDKTNGIVLYKKDGEFLLKKNKRFFLTYEKVKNKYKSKIAEYEDTDLFCIYVCFSLDDTTCVKFRMDEMNFSDMDSLSKFCESIKISHCELYDDKIKVMISGEEKTYFSYEVYHNDSYIRENAKERIFKYACKKKNPINKTEYDYMKIFSLKLDGFEAVRTVKSGM